MDFGKAFSFVFEDQEWIKKVGIAALVLLIPFVGMIAVLGWALEITRRVVKSDAELLPDWSDFGGHLTRGFKAFVIGLAWSMPSILISVCQTTGNILVANPDVANSDAGGALMAVFGVVTLCLSCISILYSLFLSVVLPAAYANFVMNGEEIGAGLRFGEIFGLIRAAIGAYLLVMVLSFVIGLVAALGLIACFIGVFFTYAVAMAITGNLYGQAYNEAKKAQALSPAM